MAAHQLLHIARRKLQELGLAEGPYGSDASLPGKKRELSETTAGTEMCQLLRIGFHYHRSASDEVNRVSFVAFGKNDLALVLLVKTHVLGHCLQFGGSQIGQEGNLGEGPYPVPRGRRSQTHTGPRGAVQLAGLTLLFGPIETRLPRPRVPSRPAQARRWDAVNSSRERS